MRLPTQAPWRRIRAALARSHNETGDSWKLLFAVACAAMLCFACSVDAAEATDSQLKTIAILPFDLLDDQSELAPAGVEYDRLEVIRRQLQDELLAHRLYRAVDVTPASSLIERYRAQLPLHACNGCEIDVARALGVDRVLVGWVQKVSNLILNINIQIEDATTGAVVLNKSVDLRGNSDESWRRGVSYIVRSMVEKRQGNR